MSACAKPPREAVYPRPNPCAAPFTFNNYNCLRPADRVESKVYPPPPKPPPYFSSPHRWGGRPAGDLTGGGGGRAGRVRRPASRGLYWPVGEAWGPGWGSGASDRRTGANLRRRNDGRHRCGLKSPARSGASQRSARRRPPSERVKNPRPEGFRPPAARSARDLSKRYSPKTFPGRARTLRRLPHPPVSSGGRAPPCVLFQSGTCPCACPLQVLRLSGTRPRACPRSNP